MLNNFENYLLQEKRYSEHTLSAYLFDVKQFLDFSGCNSFEDIKEVNYKLVRSWVVSLNTERYENKSINRKLAALRTYFRFLIKEGIIESNPLKSLKGPKVQKKLPNFVKENELERVKVEPFFKDDFAGVRDRLIFELLYQTGVRLSELIDLQDDKINKNQIKVLGKRNKERIVPISESLFDLIEEYKTLRNQTFNVVPAFFVLNNGQKVYPKFVYRKINDYLSLMTNLKVKSPHVLRHTFATHMLNNGSGLEVLKDILGHASLAATQVYTHNSFSQINSIYSSAHPRGHKI